MRRLFLCVLLGFVACSTPSTPSTPAELATASRTMPPTASASSVAPPTIAVVPVKPGCPPCAAPTTTCSRGACVAPVALGSALSVVVHFSNGTTRNVVNDALGMESPEDALEFASYSDISCRLMAHGVVSCRDDPKKQFILVPGIDDATHIAMHSSRVCASRARGDIACHGATGLYRMTKDPKVILDKLSAPVDQMVATEGHSCAKLHNGTVMCWGENGYGQCGTKKYEVDTSGLLFVREPTLVAELADVVDVALTPFSSCAALSNGTAVCWGHAIGNVINDRNAANAMLGQSKTAADQRAVATTPRSAFFKNAFRTPQIIKDTGDVTRLIFGLRRLWLLRKDGTIVSVDSDDLQSKHPRVEALAGVSGAVQIAAGYEDVCALTSGGEIQCWKETDLGAARPSPVVVRKIRLDGAD